MERKNREENVYIELGIESPEEMHAKANIVVAIIFKMQESCLTVEEASVILQVDEATLRAIISGQFHKVAISELERIREAI